MTSLVKQRELERITTHDINIRERFARRDVERIARFAARVPSIWGPRVNATGNGTGPFATTALETDSQAPTTLAGLEVYFVASSGSTLQVTAGAVLAPNPAQTSEARPAGWTGQIEHDDDAFGIFESPLQHNVTPSVPIGSALLQPEWWIVYGVPSEATIETDPTSKVFNQGTGDFDSSSQPKIVGHQLAIDVVRGVAGATLSATIATLPANAVQLAWVWVPIGATDLSTAEIFDVRKRLVDPGPNEIGGTWTNPQIGVLATPLAGKSIFRGVVRARLGGEWLEARSRVGIDTPNMAEPGASWGTGPFAPAKVAWLYLCKVEGHTPRLQRIGADYVGSTGLSDGTVSSGVLVLSPTPPILRTSPTGGAGKWANASNDRWDLRASASIALPTLVSAQVTYAFLGSSCEKEDAICVGFMLYVDTDGSGYPIVQGPVHVSPDGWHTGEALASQGVGAVLAALTATAGGGSTAPATTADLAILTVLGNEATVPIDAVRVQMTGELSASTASINWLGPESNAVSRGHYDGSATRFEKITERFVNFPGLDSLTVHRGSANGGTVSSAAAQLLGVRMPFGEPLVTLRLLHQGRGDHDRHGLAKRHPCGLDRMLRNAGVGGSHQCDESVPWLIIGRIVNADEPARGDRGVRRRRRFGRSRSGDLSDPVPFPPRNTLTRAVPLPHDRDLQAQLVAVHHPRLVDTSFLHPSPEALVAGKFHIMCAPRGHAAAPLPCRIASARAAVSLSQAA